MPRIEVAHLLQKAVLWPFESVDMFNTTIRGTPVEINVRWEYRKVQKEMDEATLGDVVVDREIATRSLMWLGELSEFQGTGSGVADAEIKEVVEYRETPDIKNRSPYRTVKLARYQGDLPPTPRVGTASNVDLLVEGTGFSFYEITTGTGTGTDDVACNTCPRLNETREAVLVSNGTDLQIWESEAFSVCEESWLWHIERDLVNNVITVTLEDTLGEVQATYRLTNVTWDGEDRITLVLTSGNNVCEWPSSLSIVGA